MATVTTRIDDETKDKLDKAVFDDKRTIQSVVENCIRHYLHTRSKKSGGSDDFQRLASQFWETAPKQVRDVVENLMKNTLSATK